MPKKLAPSKRRVRRKWQYMILSVVVVAIILTAAFFFSPSNSSAGKPIILYVNQGNALVDVGNYSSLISFAKTNGFNTLFFQVYRSGNLLFSQSNLTYFVNLAHNQSLRIFFALYFTSSNENIPPSIYGLGEDGISLDMSTLGVSTQENLLSTLSNNYKGETAVTTTNFATTLKPDLLILETYLQQDQQYVHKGVIASVEPLALPDKGEYVSQYHYALSESDGVMVFDYYGLLKTGY